MKSPEYAKFARKIQRNIHVRSAPPERVRYRVLNNIKKLSNVVERETRQPTFP